MPVEVAVVMGGSVDWAVMSKAVDVLNQFGIGYEALVLSAHRMPDEMFRYAEAAESRGLRAIIAGAGGAAHLPGMLAAKTLVPVLGVPIPVTHLNGVDALHSILQMPGGIPVATFAIGAWGATNAGLFAVQILAAERPELMDRLVADRRARHDRAVASQADLTAPDENAP